MKNEKTVQLVKKYLKNAASAKERGILESWYIKTAEQANDLPDNPDYTAIQNEILHKLRKQQVKNLKTSWQWISAAAAIVLIVGSGIYFYGLLNKEQAISKSTQTSALNQISPGRNKAYLTLSNGKRIALTDIANGELAEQSGIKITKTADGQLVYTSMNKIAHANSSQFNKIEAPAGGQYQLQLPDGTRVWLNSSSSLKYPVSFSGTKKRRVELEGEAYFEVVHDKDRPFSVLSGKQVVEVLGTRFNINCYANELNTKTSLLAGAVKLLTHGGASSSLLQPGQQAVFNGDEVKVSDTDVEQAIAWKNGDFVFNGEDLQTVMRQIARWYDVEVSYVGNVPADAGFVSTISRKKEITEILKAIEMNQGVKFKLEGRRIIVMP